MFITNGDGTQQRVHGVGEVCLPFYDCNKAKYTFNLQRALYVPSFKFHLISVSLLVKQGNTVIFNQIRIYVWDNKKVFFGLNIVQKSPICQHCLLLSGMQGFTHAKCETLKKTANQAVKGMVISGSLSTDKCISCSECKISTSDIPEKPQVRATRKF